MLGNGYCARPVGLDCHFEFICESCTFFQTTIEFFSPMHWESTEALAARQDHTQTGECLERLRAEI